MSAIERRHFVAEEMRAVTEDGQPPKIIGYAALFNSQSRTLGGPGRAFREVIEPGAFGTSLETSDVRALFNHDPNYVLGRVKAGTLAVSVDQRGLRMENTPPEAQWAKDLLVSIARGDIDQMSFGFRIAQGGDAWERRDGGIVRRLQKFEEIFDVSPVTQPAYEDTTVALRSLADASGVVEAADAFGISLALAEQILRHRGR